MDNKLLKVCLAACLAVSFAGCDDVDKDVPKAGDSCTVTFHSVLGKEYGMTCLNNKLIVTQCGDGKVQGAEQCEGTDIGNATCKRKLGEGAVGKVSCKGCLLDYTACSLPTTPASGRIAGTCGDGVLNVGEDCDGTNLDNQSCGSLIVNGKGTLSCNACKFDYSGCFVGDKAPEDIPPAKTCGNGKLDDDELCDVDTDGNVIILGNATCADALQDENATGEIGCTESCQLDVDKCEKSQVISENCGNGNLDEDEECDLDEEDNALLPDGASCATALENDDATGTLSCTSECKVDTSACDFPEVLCGNGVLDDGEFCDGDLFVDDADLTVECAEGFAQTSHPCNADCSAIDAEAACEVIPENCGNGALDDGEPCDGDISDGKTCADIIEGSEGELSCNPVCKYDLSNCFVTHEAECGNGIVEEYEECDDGNLEDGDGCSSECKEEFRWCTNDDECLDGAKCDRGFCLTDDMLTLEEGDPCDPDTFVRFCKEDSIVYCDVNTEGEDTIKSIKFANCGEYGGCGVIVKTDYNDKPYLSAVCNGTRADECIDENTKLSYCYDNDGNPYASYYSCKKNTAGGFALEDARIYRNIELACQEKRDNDGNLIADASCNESGTQCENPVMLWCDFDRRCIDENTFEVCENEHNPTIHTYVCNDEGNSDSVCATVEGRVDCYTPCSEDGENISKCNTLADSTVYAETYTCMMGSDDNLYYVKQDSERCYHECVEDPVASCTKLFDYEGSPCDSYSFLRDRCEGDVVVSCVYDHVEGFACDAGTNCITHDGYSECLTPCDNLDDRMEKCIEYSSDEESTSADVFSFVCTELDDGMFFVGDYDNPVSCESNLCNETHDACFESEAELVPCDNIGENVNVCTQNEDVAYISVFECIETDDGNYLLPVADTYTCTSGLCNDDFTDCSEPEE